jgi:hypothetical protein
VTFNEYLNFLPKKSMDKAIVEKIKDTKGILRDYP